MIQVNSFRRPFGWLAPLLAVAAIMAMAGQATGQSDPPFKRLAVAAANPLAAEAGRAILLRGGGAIDAAIAVQMVLNVVEPQASGIGGGGLMLYWDAKARKLYAYDGREMAPASARPDMFLADGKPMPFPAAVVSASSIGVPGVLALLDLVHRQHGKLAWNDLFEPAILLAERGIKTPPRLARLLAQERALQNDPAARAIFFDADGKPRRQDDLIGNPALATTLRLLAKDGIVVFYRGALAQAIVDAVNVRARGTLHMDDLSGYAAKTREPVCAPYRAYRVCGFPPPSSGGIAILQALAMLETFDMPAMDRNTALPWHVIAEASKLAFADRNRYVADADVVPVPVTGLLDRTYLRGRASAIKQDSVIGAPAEPGQVQQGEAPPAGLSPELPGTSHMSIVDAEGNVLSFTTTIEAAFGARLMVGGFLLNNELTDFSFIAERDGRPVANRAQAGKRPRSSMSPTIVFDADGRPMLAIGSAGGATIIGATLKTIVGVLDWNLPVQAAIDLPNLWNMNGPTDVEPTGAGVQLAEALKTLGHDVRPTRFETGLHGVRIRPGAIDGGADPRRDGAVRGE